MYLYDVFCYWFIMGQFHSLVSNPIRSRFVTMAAPRTALAFDSLGRLLVVAVDGDEPTDKGLSLYQFADLLIEYGAVNAVNTDGMYIRIF